MNTVERDVLVAILAITGLTQPRPYSALFLIDGIARRGLTIGATVQPVAIVIPNEVPAGCSRRAPTMGT